MKGHLPGNGGRPSPSCHVSQTRRSRIFSGAPSGRQSSSSSPETGLRFIDRIGSGFRSGLGRPALRIGARLGLPLAALEVLPQLCGQSLLTQDGLFGFAHGWCRNRIGAGAVDRRFLALRRDWAYGKGAPVAPGTCRSDMYRSRCRTEKVVTTLSDNAPRCCRSSVVEHPLGKGEADSSILSGSTISTH